MVAGASQDLFVTPKPTGLIDRILQIATVPGDLVLDSFAGSGTTAHAVLKSNTVTLDQVFRQFLLIEIEPNIAEKVTAERIRRVVQGYDNAKGKPVSGLGGGFRFCRLGPTLFDASGRIRDTVTFADLARHIYFTETGEPQPETDGAGPLLGVHRGAAIYLLFDDAIGGQPSAGGNVLTQAVLDALPPHAGPRIVYGEGCLLSPAGLHAQGVVFRQIPYEVRVR